MTFDGSVWQSRIFHYFEWFTKHPVIFIILGIVVIFFAIFNWDDSSSGAGMIKWIIFGGILFMFGLVSIFGFWG